LTQTRTLVKSKQRVSKYETRGVSIKLPLSKHISTQFQKNTYFAYYQTLLGVVKVAVKII